MMSGHAVTKNIYVYTYIYMYIHIYTCMGHTQRANVTSSLKFKGQLV